MRNKKAKRRPPVADEIYQNRLVAKFINKIMHDGKKTVAQNSLYKAFEVIEKKSGDPVQMFEKALQSIGPKQEVRPRRVGGASYQIPVEVRGERKVSLAIRWLITAARKRSNKEYHSFSEKLAAEILDAVEGKGEAIKKRDTVQKMADANRAFAHFRW